MLSGNVSLSEWVSSEEMIDRYLAEHDPPKIIDLSGGSPDLVPEWIAWTMDTIESRGLSQSIYLWSDDNLSSDLLISQQQRTVLERIERYTGYGRVCCLKGLDGASFTFTTGVSEDEFELQLKILKAYLATSIDLYGYITLAYPPAGDDRDRICRLMDRLQVMRSDFLGRLVPLRVERFSPMVGRLSELRNHALRHQDELVEIWTEELARRSVYPIWSGL
jgi:uncharacterized Fe-S cluster-containing radical SAM superfamily protein